MTDSAMTFFFCECRQEKAVIGVLCLTWNEAVQSERNGAQCCNGLHLTSGFWPKNILLFKMLLILKCGELKHLIDYMITSTFVSDYFDNWLILFKYV